MNITDKLFEYQDKEYAEFQAKLTPGIPLNSFIGVRIPDIRKIAKEIVKNGGYDSFLQELPHAYYDENILHGAIISEIKDFDKCLNEVERFLPYVDNWAVCDTMSPKVFKKNKSQIIVKIREWVASNHTYTCRFGMGELMSLFLDDDFLSEYLEIPASVKSDEYYVNMMIAWFFATALAKQWDATFPYIENKRLDVWTHNKTIQKAVESFRITKEQKELLRTYKIKKSKS